MSKRIVICCDGTWNEPEQRDNCGPAATNVAKFASAVRSQDAAGTAQVVYYHKGVGTRGVLDRLTGGAFGTGLSENIEDCYLFLVNNYVPGDELYLVGFSRGAYSVRSLAGLIRNSGILRAQYLTRYAEAYKLYRYRSDQSRPSAEPAKAFRAAYAWPDAELHFIGVWDTVGALGIPVTGLRRWKWNRKRYEFHDVMLSTRVRYAYQALALDERRKAFEPTLWQKQADAPATQVLAQAWFPGVHSDVGGGYGESGLSDCALTWMCERAVRSGLAMDLSLIPSGEVTGPMHESLNWFYRLIGAASRKWGASNPTGYELLHRTAIERAERDPHYGGDWVQCLSKTDRAGSEAAQ